MSCFSLLLANSSLQMTCQWACLQAWALPKDVRAPQASPWLLNIGRPGCPIVSLQLTFVMQATPYQLSLLKTRLTVVDDALKNQGFIVGDKFSAADIQLAYALCIAQVSNMHYGWHVWAAAFTLDNFVCR